MVLEDVTEMYVATTNDYAQYIWSRADSMRSDPAEGNVKLPKILLNGNNICMVS
jgi:small nuclear ribonucleoprotein (snRNP)-like protein